MIGYDVVWNRKRAQCVLIGDPDCRIMKRWNIYLPRDFKLRIHRMFALTSDRDPHDHPWPFVTFVVRGSYEDHRRDGKVDRLHAGSMRFRSAMHTHRTFAGPRGAWTIVLSWPIRRKWGFWHDGEWFGHRDYQQRFGSGMICETDLRLPHTAGRSLWPSRRRHPRAQGIPGLDRAGH